MRLSSCMFAVLLAIAGPVDLHAQPTHAVAVGGTGREPCAAWTQDRNAEKEPGRQTSEGRIEWISGFFSAVNLFAEPSGNLHGGIDDRDGMLSWIDNYCRAHPGDPLFAAAANLVLQLRRQSASPKP